MHEVALAQAVWRQVLREMRTQAPRRLVGLNLVVGEFSGADPESLAFALGLLVAESPWPGAEVRTRPEDLVLECRACGRQHAAGADAFLCPGCGGSDLEPVRGMDLRLESLEVE